jgi:kinesin family protein C1
VTLALSFSGDGKTLMMINLSPTELSYFESLSTLRFGAMVNSCELGRATRKLNDIDADAKVAPASRVARAWS